MVWMPCSPCPIRCKTWRHDYRPLPSDHGHPERTRGLGFGSGSGLLHELGLQSHLPDALDAAIDIVIAFDQADTPDLGPHFGDGRRAFDFQILDQRDAVAIAE